MDAFVQWQVDVLIVGAGPACCMAASRYIRYEIDFRLIGKRAARMQVGHASGVYNNYFMPLPLLTIE